MKKKVININFRYFWKGFNPNDNFFTNLLRKHYDVKISNNPDYLFYSVYPDFSTKKSLYEKGEFMRKVSPRLYLVSRKIYSKLNSLSKKRKITTPKGNFVKIFVGLEYTKPNMEECDWAFSPHLEEEINHPNHIRIPTFLLNEYKLKNLGIPPIKKKINVKKIKKEKTKFCNFIYSQEILPRNNFFKKLSQYKRVDSPGRCMNNMGPISQDSPKNSRLSLDWMEEKLEFLRKYKFTIAFENYSKSGWVTEKLTHPMLVDSIPIYLGHKDVKIDFNTKSFINFHDFKNMDEFIKHIIEVDNNDELYEKYLREPWHINNKIPESMDEKIILKKLKKIFG